MLLISTPNHLQVLTDRLRLTSFLSAEADEHAAWLVAFRSI